MKLSKKLFATSAAVGIAAIGVATLAPHASMADGEKEKCYGVAKAGANDCGTSAHSCAGHATEDSAANEFVLVPAGLCERLAGGSTKASE